MNHQDTARAGDCHDPFWPRIDLNGLRKRLKLQRTTGDAAIEVAAHCAVIKAAREFANWRVALRSLGYRRLDDVCGHDHGRALRICYLCFVDAAIMLYLGLPYVCSPRRGVRHG
ncbi:MULTISPECIES: head completion/stabilization protein [Pseudomonas]|uniref:head completion/stabilization protein n=1 Tax=Pseudomonas TaxID=286 RepID=UPI0011A16648|nr:MULTISPECIES: head completion/stabilization protein [Pseudomonas]MBF8693109.1 head completion/stabilization protein [Pseudomonas fulva]